MSVNTRTGNIQPIYAELSHELGITDAFDVTDASLRVHHLASIHCCTVWQAMHLQVAWTTATFFAQSIL